MDAGLFAWHVRRMRAIYQARYEKLLAVLTRDFETDVMAIPSSVGLHVSVLACTASVDQMLTVVRRASAAGVECFPLSWFAAGRSLRSGLLLGYGAIELDRIEPGLARLKECFVSVVGPRAGA
jgi:GntR family transcriptional regulator/MocR family aminotransferase